MNKSTALVVEELIAQAIDETLAEMTPRIEAVGAREEGLVFRSLVAGGSAESWITREQMVRALSAAESRERDIRTALLIATC